MIKEKTATNNTHRWKMELSYKSKEGKQAREIYDKIYAGGEKCAFCACALNPPDKFWLLPELQNDSAFTYSLNFAAVCFKCGTQFSKAFQKKFKDSATLDGENVRQTPGRLG